MFIRMRESKGFTLVELMIVVAIIGILAAAAVPYYQKYIQKSRLVSKVFPLVRTCNLNLATYFSVSSTPSFPQSGATFVTAGASTACATPTYTLTNATNANLLFQIASAKSCPELTVLSGMTFHVNSVMAPSGNMIAGWQFGGPLAQSLGLTGVQ